MSTTEGKTVMVQGRIVWTSGDLFKGKVKTDQNTKQPIISQKTGQPVIEYGFGLAVPKAACGEVWNTMQSEAMSLYQGRQVPPGFAMKFKDGDTDIDPDGAPYSQREGYPGCIVLACTTQVPIKFFRFENGQHFQVNEGIKCGDYVNVQLSVKAHPAMSATSKPGLYLNPNAVQFLGYGTEIVNTPSGDQLFGTQAPPLPPGASATPIAPTGMIVPPGTPAPGMPQQFGTQAPVAPVQPHYGVLPPIHQPQAQQMAPQMPGVPMGNGHVPHVAPSLPGSTMNPQQGFATSALQAPSPGPIPVPQQQQYAQHAPVTNNSGMPMPGYPPVPGGMPQYRR